MSSGLGLLYADLFKQYKLLHNNKIAQKAQEGFNAIWAEAKCKYASKDELTKFAENLLAEYRQKNSAKKASNILFYFAAANKQNEKNNTTPSENQTDSSASTLSTEKLRKNSLNGNPADLEPDKHDIPGPSGTQNKRSVCNLESDEEAVDDPNTAIPPVKRVRSTPAQDQLKKESSLLEAELELAIRRRDSVNSDGNEQRQVMKLRNAIEQCKKKLQKKQKHAERAKKYRRYFRSKIETVCSLNPEAASTLKFRAEPGRPRLEENQPELLKTIVELAMFGASAEERRRCEIVRSCRTLTDLHTRLVELGYQVSRSSTYIRLLPRRYNTLEGKRHVTAVPVKLSRPEADHHKAHSDQYFCTATIRSIETIASILGPSQVCFISQDDKARVPIGMTAANKQAPLLMHVDYRVYLPDHDWVIATKHKLIPSVYAGCVIKGSMGHPEAVTYTGPTYIAVRSGKHSSSTASTHAVDFQKLVSLESFREIMRDEKGSVKPIMMISSDGGPDENPRYPKVIAHAISHFIEYDLDAIFLFTNAPGRSAFNRVERRMAPLSRELSGAILPHDTYGSHLDDRGRTMDSILEKENFRKAGEVLAEIWSSVVIDGKPVVAEYIEPNASAERSVPEMPSQEWLSEHVRNSQYFLQVIKCDDRECCRELRSSLRVLLPERFLPPPFPVLQTLDGLKIPKPQEHDGKSFASFLLRRSLNIAPQHDRFPEVPYDTYCPTLCSVPQLIESRTCTECGLYFCSKKSVAIHKSSLHKKAKKVKTPNNKVVEESFDETESLTEGEETGDEQSEQSHDNQSSNAENAPLISIEENAQNPWTEAD